MYDLTDESEMSLQQAKTQFNALNNINGAYNSGTYERMRLKRVQIMPFVTAFATHKWTNIHHLDEDVPKGQTMIYLSWQQAMYYVFQNLHVDCLYVRKMHSEINKMSPHFFTLENCELSSSPLRSLNLCTLIVSAFHL